MKARQQKAAHSTVASIQDAAPAIRAEDFTTFEINSFSESPFGQLISMLSFNIILKSTLLTDKLLRLLSFISIGLPDAVQIATLACTPLATASPPTSATAAATAPPTADRTEAASDNPSEPAASAGTAVASGVVPALLAVAGTSGSGAQTSAPSTSRAKAMSLELDERCLPESQECLRLAIEVLTSKSCSEEGLEDATSLLLNLSQCSNVTRSFILNLLIDGSKYLAGIVQQQINDLIVDLKQLNQRNRLECGGSAAIVPHPAESGSGDSGHQSGASAYSTMPSTSSAAAKGILQDRFTKEKVIITSTSKQKTRCELQLPSMVPLISKTASQSFFLRILKVVIQIRESTNTVRANV